MFLPYVLFTLHVVKQIEENTHMKNTTIAAIVASTLITSVAAPLAFAHEAGDIVVRAGVTTVAPDDSSSNIMAGGDLGLGVKVDSNTQLGLNVAYFLTDNWNIELLAATPFSHDIDFGVADPLGTGDQLGSTKHLPPTITANYYFSDANAKFQPYVGVGVNYTVFFDEEFTSANDGAGLTDLSLDNSFGLAAQVGADYEISEGVAINASVRYISIETEASFMLGETAGKIDTVTIDPWVYTVSVAYTF